MNEIEILEKIDINAVEDGYFMDGDIKIMNTSLVELKLLEIVKDLQLRIEDLERLATLQEKA